MMITMIKIEEIPVEQIEEFWKIHFEYLIQDGIISDIEDKEYFQSDKYHMIIREHMNRNIDKHHLAYFVKSNIKIGAVSYCIYKSKDGKCFILDYWIFPQFRCKGNSHKCFNLLKEDTSKDDALYYEINCDGRADRMKFWKSNGFVENGIDENGVILLIKH